MGINLNYLDVYIIKKKKSRRKKIFGVLILCVLALGLIFWSGYKIFRLFHHNYIGGQDYFAVYVPLNSLDSTKAEAEAKNFRTRGGAGVIIKLEKVLGVVLAVYPSLNEALAVIENLKRQQINCDYCVKSVARFSLDKMDTKQRDLTVNLFGRYELLLDNFYQMAIDLDSGKIVDSEAFIKINEWAVLWEQRVDLISDEVLNLGLSFDEIKDNPLYSIYELALKVAGQLNFLVMENANNSSLISLVSLIRQVHYYLII